MPTSQGVPSLLGLAISGSIENGVAKRHPRKILFGKPLRGFKGMLRRKSAEAAKRNKRKKGRGRKWTKRSS